MNIQINTKILHFQFVVCRQICQIANPAKSKIGNVINSYLAGSKIVIVLLKNIGKTQYPGKDMAVAFICYDKS